MDFKDFLKIMVAKDGSDLYLTTGAPPTLKVHGELTQLEPVAMASGMVKEIAYKVMDKEQIAAFEAKPEMNMAISEPG